MEIIIPGTALLAGLLSAAVGIVVLIGGVRHYLGSQAHKTASAPTTPLEALTGTTARDVANRNKYERVDVFKLRGPLFSFGLVVALGVAFLAFNWIQYESKPQNQTDFLLIGDDALDVIIPRTNEAPPLPPPPPPPPPKILEIVPDDQAPDSLADFLDTSEGNNQYTPPSRTPAPALPPPPPPPPPAEPSDEHPFIVVEQMPLFPGCDELFSEAEKRECSTKALLQFVYQNIQYPAIARESTIQGTVVIFFVIEKDGTISEAQIKRDVGGLLGEEALRVVNLMNTQNLRWTPGRQRGRPVRVQFHLPIRFALM